MRVLVGCEYSGTVRDAFTARGHYAMSADILPTESPGPHHQGDVRDLFAYEWDLAIFHPPCTYLTNAGVRWLHERPERWEHMKDAAAFFLELLNAPIRRVAVENPIMHGHATSIIGRHSQIIHPWQYGHPESKATALWLRNLPPLITGEDTQAVMTAAPAHMAHRIHRMPPGPDRAKLRSLTFPNIAAAMAEQWGAL